MSHFTTNPTKREIGTRVEIINVLHLDIIFQIQFRHTLFSNIQGLYDFSYVFEVSSAQQGCKIIYIKIQ